MATLEEIETNDMEKLRAMLSSPKFNSAPFGVSRVQRYFRIGYYRALRLLEKAIEVGLLERDEKKPGQWRPVKNNVVE